MTSYLWDFRNMLEWVVVFLQQDEKLKLKMTVHRKGREGSRRFFYTPLKGKFNVCVLCGSTVFTGYQSTLNPMQYVGLAQ